VSTTPAAPSPAASFISADPWKQELAAGRAALREAFVADPRPHRLLWQNAQLVDRIVRRI